MFPAILDKDISKSYLKTDKRISQNSNLQTVDHLLTKRSTPVFHQHIAIE